MVVHDQRIESRVPEAAILFLMPLASSAVFVK